MYHVVHNMQREKHSDLSKILGQCLTAFINSGTLDLSLDQIAKRVGLSKRMLIHYFRGRENIEEGAMKLLEDRLRKQFAPEAFSPSAPPTIVVAALWKATTNPESRGVLLLVMDLSRRAWSGSLRAKAFYEEQRRLWVRLLMTYIRSRSVVEGLLQLYQGAVLS